MRDFSPLLVLVYSFLFTIVNAIAGESFHQTLPLGLPAPSIPSDNLLTPQKVHLGKQLFFDPRLSSDDHMSCASCHDPAMGWSNGAALPKGRDGELLLRGVPTLVNVGCLPHFFWDGRSKTLEEAVVQPIAHQNEMNLLLEEAVTKLNAIEGYRRQFHDVFEEDASVESIGKALATFLRTMLAGNAPFDRFRAGDLKALSPAAIRGHDVFFFRSNCAACHRGPLLTDSTFQNIGIGMDQPEPDLGRYLISKDDYYSGKFKTPTLRDISRTAPYMHDGRFETLREVVQLYVEGGLYNATISVQINELPLSDQEQDDLVTFLEEGLTSSKYPNIAPPDLPD